MSDPEPLLLSVFHELRRQGVPLGVGEYLLAVATLAAQARPLDEDLVWWLCRLLWAKSEEDQHLFDVAFRRHIDVRPDQAPPVAPSPPLLEAPAQPVSEPDEPPPEQSEPEPAASPDAAKEPTNSAISAGQLTLGPRAAMAALARAAPNRARFQYTPRLPMAQRDMSGIWRHLRRLQRQGPAEDLDVEGTIERISRSGMFLGPVLQPRRRNRVRLVLLIDRDDAMAAFAPIVEGLVQSILRGGLLGQTAAYYFRGFPDAVLYERSSLQCAIPVAEALAERAPDSSVLFISDAGAAMGRYESNRVEGVNRFLKTLRRYTYRYAWLNPAPKPRWGATTADAIAKKVPMYPLDRDGLIDSVNILRGHPFPPGVG
jgi:uncharacterized protein with von Willebrand factor type A (vWA) domain